MMTYLDSVQARLASLRELQSAGDEYEVVPVRLEQDLIELVEHLLENGLVELDQA